MITAVSVAAVRPVVKNERVLLDAEARGRLGARLRGLRTEHNLTQLEIAERAGISVGTVQTIESGARETRDENVDAVARALGTSLTALLQQPHVDPTDPLLKGLNREDLEIARLYHDAPSPVRERMRQAGRDEAPARQPPAADDLALAAQITRLRQSRRELLIDILRQLVDALDDKVG